MLRAPWGTASSSSCGRPLPCGRFDLRTSGCCGSWTVQGTFARIDRDRSGTVNAKELNEAIRSYGYSLTPKALDVLVKRYSKRSNGQHQCPPPASSHRGRHHHVRRLPRPFRASARHIGGLSLSHPEHGLTLVSASAAATRRARDTPRSTTTTSSRCVPSRSSPSWSTDPHHRCR
jgi:hypothetical protein